MPAGLRIVNVERIVVQVPFTPRCAEWNARELWRFGLIEVIRVTTDVPDIVGYGEALLYYPDTCLTGAAVERVRGRNPADLLGDDTLGYGLQMAMYDIVGQALGVPIARLFNLPLVRSACPIAWWTYDMPPAALAEEAAEAVGEGYSAYKIKARPWWDIYAQVAAISAVTPPHFRLDIDWNSSLLNAGNAAPVLAELDRQERVAIYESPILQHDIEGLRQLRRKTTRPLALHFGDPPFSTTVREEICDGFVVSGGVTRMLQQAAQATVFEKPFWLQLVGTGLTTAYAAHLSAVLPFAQWPMVTCLNNYADDLLEEPLKIHGGALQLPEAPGLGVSVDEDALLRLKLDPPYDLPEPRMLCSVVWPGGRVVHFAHMYPQCWNAFMAGNLPVQEPGVRLEVHPDDGSPAWAELYARAEQAPVYDRR